MGSYLIELIYKLQYELTVLRNRFIVLNNDSQRNIPCFHTLNKTSVYNLRLVLRKYTLCFHFEYLLCAHLPTKLIDFKKTYISNILDLIIGCEALNFDLGGVLLNLSSIRV